jgi:CRP/FNR family transcriptional regulator, dissimilatory nitrate respiration regulator
VPVKSSHQHGLPSLALIRELSSDELYDLTGSVREQRFSKGQVLFDKGDMPDGFYVLAEGRVELAFPTDQGGERVLEIINPLERFSEAWMFLDRPYPVLAQALQDSVVLAISSQEMMALLEKDCKLARKMLAGIRIRLRERVANQEACSMKSSTHRVACMLYHMA